MLNNRFMQLLKDPSQICVINSGWYDTQAVIQGIDKVGKLLSSNDPAATRPKACLQNVLAKLAAPAGDPYWDYGWTPEWQEECIRLVERGVITTDQGGYLVCKNGARAHERVEPTTQEKLLESVKRIVCVTRQRVYAEVTEDFFSMMGDKGRFAPGVMTQWNPHRRHLKALLEDVGSGRSPYRFKSWREKRKRGSLQCALAVPSTEGGQYFVDIDIDEWNPFADVISLFEHQAQTTDHEALQDKPYFLSQAEVSEYLRDLLKHT